MHHHRSDDFDRIVLPECQSLVQAIGHRMAYEAAVAADVDQCLIDVYVASCIKLDSAWYVEKLGLSRLEQREMEATAIDKMFPRLEEFLALTEVAPYISAPIVSEERWAKYISNLPPCGFSQVCGPTSVILSGDVGADDPDMSSTGQGLRAELKEESWQSDGASNLQSLGTVG